MIKKKVIQQSRKTTIHTENLDFFYYCIFLLVGVNSVGFSQHLHNVYETTVLRFSHFQRIGSVLNRLLALPNGTGETWQANQHLSTANWGESIQPQQMSSLCILQHTGTQMDNVTINESMVMEKLEIQGRNWADSPALVIVLRQRCVAEEGAGGWGGGSVGALHLQASSVHAWLEKLDDFTIPSRFLLQMHAHRQAPTHIFSHIR